MGSNVGKKNDKQNIEYETDRNRGDYDKTSKSNNDNDSDDEDYSSNYDDSEYYKDDDNTGSTSYATTTKSTGEKTTTTKSRSETDKITNTERSSKPSGKQSNEVQPLGRGTGEVPVGKQVVGPKQQLRPQQQVGPQQQLAATTTLPQKPDDVKIEMPVRPPPGLPAEQRSDLRQPVFVKKKQAVLNQMSEHSTSMVRLFLAELLGTTIFVLFARGAKAQVIFGRHMSALTLNQTEMDPYNFGYLMYGDTMAMAVGGGIGYAIGIGVTLAVSGGHLNPAISLAVAMWRMMDCCSFIIYCCSQHLGSMLGILLVYSLESKTMQELDIRKPFISSQVFGPTQNFPIFG